MSLLSLNVTILIIGSSLVLAQFFSSIWCFDKTILAIFRFKDKCTLGLQIFSGIKLFEWELLLVILLLHLRLDSTLGTVIVKISIEISFEMLLVLLITVLLFTEDVDPN
jgi:hypothetical protein